MGTITRRAFLLVTLLAVSVVGVLTVYGYFKYFGPPGSFRNFINQKTISLIDDTPEAFTFAGMDGTFLDNHSHRFGDYTGAKEDELDQKIREAITEFRQFNYEELNERDKLSHDVIAWMADTYLKSADHEYSGYPISQLSGPHIFIPSLMTDTHTINSKQSIENYLARLRDYGRVLEETYGVVEEYTENGVIAPDFIVEKTIAVLEAFIKDGPTENILVTSLRERMDKVRGLTQNEKDAFVSEVETILKDIVIPAYEKLIAQQKILLPLTNSEASIQRIPNGVDIYKNAIRLQTTTDLSADDLHETGLSEVVRIEAAMDKILVGQGLIEGSVSERVRILMESPEHLFPNTDEGRDAMIAYMEDVNTDILNKADDFFVTIPDFDLEIKRIPEFSESSAPGGYYHPPMPKILFLKGRPGRFFINQKDTADNPKWTLDTLLFHEAAPGHHFQISRGLMVKNVPFILMLGPFSGYTEGWALYAERVAAEDMGMYDDNPLGDLGRLQAEQFRAVRLVVDTGLHHKRWTREQAIDYMVSKTGMTEAGVTREIERYVVWPGQALAYKTGQLAILRMRARAEDQLGDTFNLRLFNEMILEGGAMPLGILDREVDGWIAEQKG